MKKIKTKRAGKGEMKNIKKADITTSQVVLIVLLVAGFAIILYFIYRLYWGGQVNEQVCHESVVLRGTLPSLGQGYVPLKCRTEKICITPSILGTCKEFEGVKGVTRAKISKDKDAAIEEIGKVVAQEMYGCWSMMGEGKLSLFSQFTANKYGLGKVHSTCIICSRIAFDTKNLKEIGITSEELEKVDIEDYMMTHAPAGKDISYFEYLSGGKGVFAKIDKDLEINAVIDPEEKDAEGNIIKKETPESISLIKRSEPTGEKTTDEVGDEIGVLFMQISSPEQLASLKNIALHAGIAWGASFMTDPDLTMGVTNLAAKGVGSIAKAHPLAAFLVAAGIVGAQQGLVAWNRGIAAGYCGDVTTANDARNGCTVVRAVNYNAEQISDYCGVIEGIE